MSGSRRIAFDVEEAAGFSGTAVVVDLFRFSNTVCALLCSGRKEIRVFSSPRIALAEAEGDDGAELFSEIDLDSPKRKDNSPYQALNSAGPLKAAYVVTRSGAPAVMSLLSAREILIGCFANLPLLSRRLADADSDILVVPACLFYDRNHVEDFICAETILDALDGRDTFNSALLEIHKSGRIIDFISNRPENGRRDLEIILRKGNLPVLPRAKILGDYAKVDAA